MLRNFLRVISGLAGFCLWVPGGHAILAVVSYADSRTPVHPAFDTIALWFMTATIWGVSLLLLRFAAKAPA
jgi:hypothetical protein